MGPILIEGDRIKPMRFGAVEVHAINTGAGWYAVALGPVASVIARAERAMPDDAVRAALAGAAEFRDALIASPLGDACECGSIEDHTCDPATVRMDTLDMMPTEEALPCS
jgi:hypothetical protein